MGGVCILTELPSDLPPPGERDLQLPAARNSLDEASRRLNERSLNVICFKGCF